MRKKAQPPPAPPEEELSAALEAPQPTLTAVPATIQFIDNPMAPELFASEAVGFFMQNGVVTITLTSTHVDHQAPPGTQSRVVIGRLVLPARGAQALAAGLYDFLKKMGADPVPRDEHQTMQ